MKFRTSDSLAQMEFDEKNLPFKTNYFKAGKTTLHYAESASDSSLPTIFFIHGSPGSWNAFERYMQDSALLQRFRMISIDRPGFGYSEFGKAKNLADQSVVIGKLLKHLENGKSICLVGHSLGAPVAVKLAVDNPGMRITDLVLLAGSVDPSEEKPENWRITLDRSPLRYLIPGAFRPSNAELLMFKQDVDEMPGALAKITCRVLIMQGDKDTFVPPGNAIYAQQHLIAAKEVRLVWLKGEEHFIPWSRFSDIRDSLLTLPMDTTSVSFN